MTPENIPLLVDRAYNILSSLKNQNSAADIHEVSNMRHTASLFIDQVHQDPECISDELALQIIVNLEKKLVDFYKGYINRLNL